MFDIPVNLIICIKVFVVFHFIIWNRPRDCSFSMSNKVQKVVPVQDKQLNWANRGGPDDDHILMSDWMRWSFIIWIVLKTILVNIRFTKKNTSLLQLIWTSHEWMSILWEEAFVCSNCHCTYNFSGSFFSHFYFIFLNAIKCSLLTIAYYSCLWENTK